MTCHRDTRCTKTCTFIASRRKEETRPFECELFKGRPVNHYEIISVHKVESICAFKWSSRRNATHDGLDLVPAMDRNFIVRNKWLRLSSITSCETQTKMNKKKKRVFKKTRLYILIVGIGTLNRKKLFLCLLHFFRFMRYMLWYFLIYLKYIISLARYITILYYVIRYDRTSLGNHGKYQFEKTNFLSNI